MPPSPLEGRSSPDGRSGLIPSYAQSEAAHPSMWGGHDPDEVEVDQLAQCFETEWSQAVQTMMRHWSVPPTWY